MNNYKELLKLIQQYPEFPVIPMVNCELCGDDYGWYVGSFGEAKLGEYAIYNDKWYDDQGDFKEDYFNFNYTALLDEFGTDPFADYDISPELYEITQNKKIKLNKYLDSIAEKFFKKAIIVYIYQP